MLALSQLTLLAGTLIVGLALVAHTLARAADRPRAAARSGSPNAAEVGAPDIAVRRGPVGAGTAVGAGLRWYGDALIVLALVSLTVGLTSRMVAAGHGPFANQYEFALSFAWGVLGAHLLLVRRRTGAALTLLVLPVALVMLLYAAAIGGRVTPLVPALHHDVLLTLHVLTAVLAYGAAAVAAAAGTLYLVRSRSGGPGTSGAATLDALGYRAVVVSFPLMTLTIALGAVWADIAWGAYWSWDPKETASLVTWLIYGAYLHARVARGWRGKRSAWLLLLGFGAVLFTYFGNLFLGGMHSYA